MTHQLTEEKIKKFFADLADNEWILDDPYSPDKVEMPLSELEKRIRSFSLSLREACADEFEKMLPKENDGATCTKRCEKLRSEGYSCYHQTQDEIVFTLREQLKKWRSHEK